VRATIALFAGCLVMAQAPAVTPDDLLARGRASYQAGRYADAVNDLRAAADAILTPEQMQTYVNSGKFESLPKFETAVIYLAMSYAKLGRDAESREQIQRLAIAETIAPTYATLSLGSDLADFENLRSRVAAGTAPIQIAQTTQTQTTQAPPVTPDDLLARGRASYQAGRYADAINDLRAAADAILTPEQTQTYVNSGKFESLPKFETAVIYLAMSYAKLGRDAEAREQIQRLMTAESIAPTYASLPLASDLADFDAVMKRLAPAALLPPHTAVAAVASVPPPQPPPQPPPAQTAQTTTLTPEQQRELEQRIATARAAAEKEAEQRIAAERAAIGKQMQERIAAERAAAEREAAEKIAAERAAIEQQTQAQIEAIRAAAAQEVARTTVATVRRAEGMALAGDVEEANAMYARLLNAPNTPREMIAAVATGFYRTGDFPGALRAFQKLGTFARGEEDLRYYKAVALYETGRYAEAKKELECALPFIEMTDEVNRYRQKIEQMP